MDMLPASLAAERAILQKNVALSMIKQTTQMQAQIATILTNAVESVAASNRGSVVDIAA
jgi:hypothetical protein